MEKNRFEKDNKVIALKDSGFANGFYRIKKGYTYTIIGIAGDPSFLTFLELKGWYDPDAFIIKNSWTEVLYGVN